jgi:hypothetical protein
MPGEAAPLLSRPAPAPDPSAGDARLGHAPPFSAPTAGGAIGITAGGSGYSHQRSKHLLTRSQPRPRESAPTTTASTTVVPDLLDLGLLCPDLRRFVAVFVCSCMDLFDFIHVLYGSFKNRSRLLMKIFEELCMCVNLWGSFYMDRCSLWMKSKNFLLAAPKP